MVKKINRFWKINQRFFHVYLASFFLFSQQANAACTETPNCLGGTVFEDYNSNGINDTEKGVANVTVIVYDCENNETGTINTDDNGDWQICGLNDSEQYRVEYILSPSMDAWANRHTRYIDRCVPCQPSCARRLENR